MWTCNINHTLYFLNSVCYRKVPFIAYFGKVVCNWGELRGLIYVKTLFKLCQKFITKLPKLSFLENFLVFSKFLVFAKNGLSFHNLAQNFEKISVSKKPECISGFFATLDAETEGDFAKLRDEKLRNRPKLSRNRRNWDWDIFRKTFNAIKGLKARILSNFDVYNAFSHQKFTLIDVFGHFCHFYLENMFWSTVVKY